MRDARTAVLLLLGVVLVAFGCLVWPTRYRYDHLKMESETYPVRIDRISGRAEYFDGEWHGSMEPPARAVTPAPTADPLEAEFQAWKRAHPTQSPPR